MNNKHNKWESHVWEIAQLFKEATQESISDEEEADEKNSVYWEGNY